MKCNKCHAEWSPPKDRTITHCPFCSEPLYELKLESHPAKPHELLCQIVNQFDREVLGKRQLKGMLSDFMPNTERKYLRIFKQAVTDGIGSDLLKLTTETEAARIMKISTLKNKFKQNNGFSDASDYVVDCFLYALGWMTSVPEERNTNKPGVDTLSVINRQMELAFADRSLTREASQALFLLAKSLGVSEQKFGEIISKRIKELNLTPDSPVQASSKNQKTIICSRNWRVDKQNETIKIGNQYWMKNNLNVSHFRNGDPIHEAKSNNDWERAASEGLPAWCYYDNNPQNGDIYGKLYNWYALNDSRCLAPEGWHVASDKEWTEMLDFLNDEYELCNDEDNPGSIGNALKAQFFNEPAHNNISKILTWKEHNKHIGKDDFGFSALPAGGRSANGSFFGIGTNGCWWSSASYSTGNAWYRYLLYNFGSMFRNVYNMASGFSIRCIRN